MAFDGPQEHQEQEDSILKDLVESGSCRKYCVNVSNTHPSHWCHTLYLQLKPGGGIQGINTTYKGDIYGWWDSKRFSLTVISREQWPNSQELVMKGEWISKGDFSKTKSGSYEAIVFGDQKTICEMEMTLVKTEDESEEKESSIDFFANMRDHFKSSPEEQHFYDFKIICQDGGEVKCHKIMLASQIKYFEGMFRQQNCDSVNLDFPKEAVKTCIQYLYTREINLDGDNIQDILLVANYLMICKVKDKCISYIKQNLDTSNCLDILKLSDIYGIEELMEASFKVIRFNFDMIFKETKDIESLSISLLKSLFASEITLKDEFDIPSDDQTKKAKLISILDTFKDPSTKVTLGEIIENLKVEKKWYTVMTSKNWGKPGDNPTKIETFKYCGDQWKHKVIRKITFFTETWDGRLIVSGLRLGWSNGREDLLGGCEREAASFDVPDGEHISFVIGNTGWYIDNLSFICSNGKELGPIGGDGGSRAKQNSLENFPLQWNWTNTYLDGISGDVVESQGKRLFANLRFTYAYLSDRPVLEFPTQADMGSPTYDVDFHDHDDDFDDYVDEFNYDQ